jgi:hypothetical protein
MAITIGPGITLGAGATVTSTSAPPLTPVLSLDAGNPASYPGAGGYSTWTDTIGSMTFTLVNGPTYNSANGGYIQFDPGSGQYAASPTNLGTLAAWSIEAWHYYDGTNVGSGPSIFTEFPYGGGTINLGLGSTNNASDLQTWWYGPGFQTTNPYTLTPGNWYQIVGTFDGTTLNLYVNNTVVQTTNRPPGGAANPSIGYGLMTRWDPGGLWGGGLAIVNLYNSALTGTQVAQNFNYYRSRFGL